MNSSPRSHNVRAAWCGAAWAHPSFYPARRQGGRQAGPAPCFRVGGGHSVSTVSVFPSPGVLFQARGHACLGDPSPPNPSSFCLSLCCLSKTWCPDPCSCCECQQTNPPYSPPHTHTPVSTLSVQHTLRLADPPTAAATNTGINTHRGSHSTRGSCPLWDREAGLEHPGSGFRPKFHSLAE